MLEASKVPCACDNRSLIDGHVLRLHFFVSTLGLLYCLRCTMCIRLLSDTVQHELCCPQLGYPTPPVRLLSGRCAARKPFATNLHTCICIDNLEL
ncbi:hypothetical protein AG1IA_07000 [Rhizoctonia solani AG-1 IA]|uniref:Uncharacterized protein n=1 Tax=Thanatephorus cucumeris (strain AG1-IA) TaxID=983506 RepID=L8WLC3_THACA|nr:hypothetical protein AG1IA_07000 [Rhizoctonia solani AG-1 IA]